MRFWSIGVCALVITYFGGAAPALAIDAKLEQLQADINYDWMATAAALVLLMQIGFMLLEAGASRSKNSINVAQKNLADFALSIACFAVFGFMLMFGASQAGLIGAQSGFLLLSELSGGEIVFFTFQAMFVGTAATIMSGAVAERFCFKAYILTIPVITLLIYPVFGHWAWGNLLIESNTAWLADMGFVDFAGSTVVHGVGAWVALAAVIAVGPRLGRFDENGDPVRINGHSAVLATAGAFMLYLGWLGFNGGSTLTGGAASGPVIGNTVLAGAIGGSVAMFFGLWRDGLFRPERVINGLLGGLVAVTAGVHAVGPEGALILGAVGGVLTIVAEDFIARCKIDDVVGAVAVHGVAGVWGTIGLALVAPMDALPLDDRLSQLGVQIFGVSLAFAWAFGVAWGWFKLLQVFMPLRVSADDEKIGLNSAEHDTTLGTGQVQALLARLVESDVEPGRRLEVECGDDSSDLAELFNRLLDNIEAHDSERRMLVERARVADAKRASENAANIARWRAERDLERAVVEEIAAIVEEVAAGDLDRRAALTKQTEHLAVIGRGVNGLLEHLASMMRAVTAGAKRLGEQSALQSDAARQLADNTQSQQEAVSASMKKLRDIKGEIHETADHARVTLETAQSTNRSAETGAEKIDCAVTTMQDIKERSRRIISVVDMIDEIATKTNLLAINAAVEAARAGHHGKGFNIVAEEVRALAASTQQMAKEIADCVQQTNEAIDVGVEVVGETTTALAEIRTSASATKANMEQIHRASELQAEQSQELLAAIERIAKLGEQNLDVAHATAMSAETLSHETRQLGESAVRYAEGGATKMVERGAA